MPGDEIHSRSLPSTHTEGLNAIYRGAHGLARTYERSRRRRRPRSSPSRA